MPSILKNAAVWGEVPGLLRFFRMDRKLMATWIS